MTNLPREIKTKINYAQKIKELSTLGRLVTSTDITSYNSDIDGFEYNKWTILKLLVLHQYVPHYTKIISSRYKEYYFLDFFAGSGVGKVKKYEDVVIAGSPIIALSFTTNPFSGAIFFELNKKKLELLKSRIEHLIELSKKDEHRKYIFSDLTGLEYITPEGDCNENIDRVYSVLEKRHQILYNKHKKGIHFLAFIDPFGLTFKWKSLERILRSSIRTDIIMFINSYTLGLQAYNHLYMGWKADQLLSFIGDDYWEEEVRNKTSSINNNKERIKVLAKFLREYYLKKIRDYYLKNHRKKPNQLIIKTIELPLERMEDKHFDIVYITRKTPSGSPYTENIDYMKRMLEKTEYELIDWLLEYVARGKMNETLLSYLNDVDKLFEKYSTYYRYVGKRRKK